MKYSIKNRPLALPNFITETDQYMAVPDVEVADQGSLEDTFLTAFKGLGGALAGIGRPPGSLAGLTLFVPDLAAFQAADILELDLRYREALAGNFCEMAVVEEPGRDGMAVKAYTMMVPPDPDKIVYGTFSGPGLNAEYLPRFSVPETPEILARWRTEGIAYRAARRSAELSYGDSPRETIDIFLPDQGQNWPLHLFIHGGYWQALDKRDNGQMGELLRQDGIAVAMVNYDLCPDVSLTKVVEQVLASVVHLHGAASDLGCDPARFTVSGHSAGGHLAGLVAANDWTEKGLPADLIKGAVMISGLFELEPIRHTAVNRALKLTDAEVEGLSPIDWPPRCVGPMVGIAGGKESNEFRRQTKNLAAAWSAAGAQVEHLEMAGRDHFTVVDAMAEPGTPVSEAVLRIAQCGDV